MNETAIINNKPVSDVRIHIFPSGDNDATEIFFKTLKVEEVYLWEY